MAPFEALYGRKCRTPLFWNQTGESQLFGPDSIREAEKQVEIIREDLKAAQSRQKSYADPRRREVVLEVGDYAYLRVSPIRGLRRFNVRGKLSPRFIGPFKIVERKGEVAYQLELPAQLSGVHDVFHVSQLKKCTSEVKIEPVQLDDIQMENDLTYKEYPVKILDTSKGLPEVKSSGRVKYSGVTILRKKQLGEERMNLRKIFLSCSLNLLNLGTRFSLRG
jgi:hypothetical protein